MKKSPRVTSHITERTIRRLYQEMGCEAHHIHQAEPDLDPTLLLSDLLNLDFCAMNRVMPYTELFETQMVRMMLAVLGKEEATALVKRIWENENGEYTRPPRLQLETFSTFHDFPVPPDDTKWEDDIEDCPEGPTLP